MHIIRKHNIQITNKPDKPSKCLYCGYEAQNEADRDNHSEAPFCCFE